MRPAARRRAVEQETGDDRAIDDGPTGSESPPSLARSRGAWGFEELDTGALYRTVVAFACTLHGADLDDEDGVVARSRLLTSALILRAGEPRASPVDGRDVSDDIARRL